MSLTSSEMYNNLIPGEIDAQIRAIGNVILNYESLRNEFLSGLFNKIGLTHITARSYNNPLKPFKRGMLEVGDTVEELTINLIPEIAYDVELAEDRAFRRVIPDVRSAFHRINRQGYFKWTIQMQDLRQAFYSVSNFESFVSRLTEAVYTSDELNEYLYMKNIFIEAGRRNHFYTVQAPLPENEETGKQFMTVVRENALNMTFMSDKYNASGIMTHCPLSEQFIFITPKIASVVDVRVLASAFNQGNTDFIGNVIIVDDFGGLESVWISDDLLDDPEAGEYGTGVIAIVVDRQWLQVWDTFLANTSNDNGEGPYRNYYLHHHQILSYSPFVNAVAIVAEKGSVTKITLTADRITYNTSRTSEIRFNAVAEGEGIFSGAIIWSVASDSTLSNLTITTEGKLVIPRNDPATKITVTATSAQTPSIKATLDVTLETATTTVPVTPAKIPTTNETETKKTT